MASASLSALMALCSFRERFKGGGLDFIIGLVRARSSVLLTMK